MTLHWWMHWFWVTLCCVACVSDGVPVPWTVDGLATTLTSEKEALSTTEKSSRTILAEDDYSDSSPEKNFRIPKAIGINPATKRVDDNVKENYRPRFSERSGEYSAINKSNADDNDGRSRSSVLKINNGTQPLSSSAPLSDYTKGSSNLNDNGANDNGNNGRDSKVTWIFTGNKTSGTPGKILNGDRYRKNISVNDDRDSRGDDDLAVLPLGEPTPTRFKLVLNKTNKFIPSNILNGDKVFNKSNDVEISESIIEPSSILATAASILQGISESPRLSRARSAFPSDYQQDRRDEKADNMSFGNATGSAVDIAAVTGSCLATIVLIGTMGSLGFVVYRRRYLNPPQTLNSDKCSNPDSSGYIDDSTIRDNSEEMYSLDNDSFLNSLEAMTIQNYWTDSVKHTKL